MDEETKSSLERGARSEKPGVGPLKRLFCYVPVLGDQMNRRDTLVALLAFGATPIRSIAQQSGKIPRIGLLVASAPSAMAPRMEAFRQGLRELGYIEGKNIVVEPRYADGNADHLPALAAELVRLDVGVIVSSGPTATRAAKESTASIPVVMMFDDDPVGSGFAASLARPGTNITGLSTLAPEISSKQLELLKEVIPRLARVAVIGTSSRHGTAQALAEAEVAAGALGVKLQFLEIQAPQDLENRFQEAASGQAGGLLVLQSPVFNSHRSRIANLAATHRLPATYPRREFVEDGGLMSYGVRFIDLDRRAATYVDKILKGAKPGDLPIEQPAKFELVINLKTAMALGIKVPQSLLLRADRLIE